MKITIIKNIILQKYRLFQIKKHIVKKGGHVGKGTRFRVAGVFSYGKNLVLNTKGLDISFHNNIVIHPNATLSIGNNVGLSQISIECANCISIGNNVNIGAGCLLIDSNFHSSDWKIRRDRGLDIHYAKTAPIYIGDDVFIGARSIIGKGVSIGDRVMIAAGSVVIKDIPNDCIAGGNPCIVIKRIENEKNL